MKTIEVYMLEIMGKVQTNGMHIAFFIFAAEMLRIYKELDVLVCEDYMDQMWFTVLAGEQVIPYCTWKWEVESAKEDAYPCIYEDWGGED